MASLGVHQQLIHAIIAVVTCSGKKTAIIITCLPMIDRLPRLILL